MKATDLTKLNKAELTIQKLRVLPSQQVLKTFNVMLGQADSAQVDKANREIESTMRRINEM